MGPEMGEMEAERTGPGCNGGGCCKPAVAIAAAAFRCAGCSAAIGTSNGSGDLSIFTGVQGFKGPSDQGVNGDFGFHEGLNWGSALWDAMGSAPRFGFEADHSDLSRSNATDLHRNQYFVTAGLFHRPACNCGGRVAWSSDYLNDSFVR